MTIPPFQKVGLGDYSVPWYGPDAIASVLTFIGFTFLGLTAFAELLSLGLESAKEARETAREKAAQVRLPYHATHRNLIARRSPD